MKDLNYYIRNKLRSKARIVFRKYSLPRWLVLLFDESTVFLTFIFAYLLRFNFEAQVVDFVLVFKQSLVVLTVFGGFELVFRSFAGLIRHTTIRDIFNITLTTSFSLISLLILTQLSRHAGLNKMFNIPLSILLIHFVSITAILFFSRILIKMFYEMVSVKPVGKKKVIIFGAGAMGVLVKRVILSDPTTEYQIVAFADNNRVLQRKNLNGIPVFSPRNLSRKFLEKYDIDTMIFAITNLPASEKAEIFQFAVNLNLEILEVPPVNNWLNGQFHLDQLKRIKVQDLLCRDPIQLNMKNIAEGLRDKTILVTGAAGSIGSEIVRQLSRFRIEKLILIDNAETPMFHLENELKEHFGFAPVTTVLADVTDQVKMARIFRKYKPEIVFHAAAYKHVPLMEANPDEAIRVNVGGTMVLTKISVKYRIQKFVMISSDKAINPTNVMGASKRMCELIVRSNSLWPDNETQFVITRFGNVLDSSGSVVPIFRKQIEEGGPVTVTHPDITRYFMTIPEACQLVLEAGFIGNGGEIFVFDMGEPLKIDVLARQMIKLSGLIPDQDIKIEYTGLRPGEKLYEELLSEEEKLLPTDNPKIHVAQQSPLDHIQLISNINEILRSHQTMTKMDLLNWIKTIVPEYTTTMTRHTVPVQELDKGPAEVYSQ